MVGRLPVRHELVLWAVGLLACVGAGAWLALGTAVPMVWYSGAILGAVLGPALVGVYCHTFTAVARSVQASRG